LALQEADADKGAHSLLYGVFLPYLLGQGGDRQLLGMRVEYEAEHGPFDGRLVVHGS
jgi:hypothetical protein